MTLKTANKHTCATYRLCVAIIVASLLTALTGIHAFGNAPLPGMPKYEVRAVWLTTLGGLDWPNTQAKDEYSISKQKEELTSMLDALAAAGMNTVLMQTRVRGTVIYPSAIEPWDGCVTGTPGRSPGYDPLAFAVEECHKRGLDIQAWVVVMPVGKWNSYGCTSLRKRHPKLIVKKGDEGYMDPANPLTAGYIAGICREITTKYDVDGIHLDYIRYPETWDDNSRKAQRRKRRNSPHHAAAKPDAARIQNITGIVKAVHDSIKSAKPWVKLSCAPIGKYHDLPRRSSYNWNALARGSQDAQAWLRQGLVDQLYPMMYFRGNQFYPFALDWRENSYGRTVVPGLGIYFLSSEEGGWAIDEITRQMHVVRSCGMGYAFFREKFFTDDVKGIYGFAKNDFNRYHALVPPMTWYDTARPAAPKGLNVTRRKGETTITWEEEADDSLTYNIYASRTIPVDTQSPYNLIAIRRNDNKLTIRTDDDLYFAVTSADRYGNESEPAFSYEPIGDKLETEHKGTVTLTTVKKGNTNKINLPNKGHALDAECIMIKSLTGVAVAVVPYNDASVNALNLAPGCYMLYSLNKKGVTHRLGFVTIRN